VITQDLRPWRYGRKSGRGGGIRTPDILLPKQARYQTALHPEKGAMFNISRAASLQGLQSLGQLQKSPFAYI
jgi:hypothetical protein